MDFSWSLFIDLGIIAAALLIATLVRAKVHFFHKYLIPNALTAGFLLLLFYNFLAPLVGHSADGLGQIVYHLLSISFIAITLRDRGSKKKAGSGKERGSVGIRGTTVIVTFQYAVQALLGLFLTLFFIKTVMPDLFPAFGLFVPLGYALGPGQAYSIGQGWEKNYGFVGAGRVGLTFAAIGFLLACFGGVALINIGRKRGWLGPDAGDPSGRKESQGGVYRPGSSLQAGSLQTTESEAIDTMSANLGMVLFVYFLCFLVLRLVTYLLSMVGDMGTDLATSLWGISFIFAVLVAMLVKLILKRLKIYHFLDTGSLTRISGTAVDFMVAGAVGAISLVVIGQYWLPIVVIAVLAALVVFPTILWLSSRIFTIHHFKRAMIIFGAMTGTLPTGLALLRVLDPELKSPVANDYVYATATIFVLIMPLILVIDWPARSTLPGKGIFFWLTIIMSAGYLVIAMVLYRLWAKERAFKNPLQIWYRGGN